MITSPRSGLLAFPLAISSAVVCVLSAGCNRSEAAMSAPAERTSSISGEAAAASPHVVKDNYSVELRSSKDPYEKDKEGTLEVIVEAKGDYHINDQYPHKFTPHEKEGVRFKGPVVLQAGSFEPKRAVLQVPFTPAKAGTLTVGGKLSFSVCSDKNCLLEKQDLELAIPVK